MAERMVHGTDVIPDIEEVVDIFKGGLFDPKNFFNPVYSNSKGATIGSCLRAANPETGIVAGLKGFEYGARVTQRPAPIFFVAVLKMIENAGKKIHFYQLFSPPQSDIDHLRDGAAQTTRRYGEEDIVLMDAAAFMEEIVEVGGFYEPCTLLECDFTRNIATLDPGDNYSTQKRRWIVLHQNYLFTKLYKIACPQFTEDITLALRDVKQYYVNLSNVQIHLTHKEYKMAFMRVMQTLISDTIP